jgi:8-oxo-dGTP diphosphatase
MGAKQQGANQSTNRWMTIPRTLAFIRNGDDILLMKRAATKRIFPNQYNGLGGHLERDEDPLTGAKREILEESGLSVQNLHLRAIYNIDAGQETGILLFVYLGESDSREITVETEEGRLEWVPIAKLSDYDLVEDLPLILPRILDMEKTTPPYSVHVSYDENDSIQMRFVSEDD